MAVCRIDEATGDLTVVADAPGRDLEAWSLSSGDALLATVENDRGYAVVRMGTPTGERTMVTGLPPGVAGELAWSPDGRTLALSASGPVTPAGIYVVDAATNQARPVWVPDAPAHPVPFDLVQWVSFDGRTTPGWFARPTGAMPPAGWPVVVWVHGGPAGQTRANFRADMQMLLAQGYEVLMPNVRGSTGYGRTATASDGRRCAAGYRARPGRRPCLARRPTGGWILAGSASWASPTGGYMVLAAIGEYPALWRTAIDYYGIADFTTLLAETGPWRRTHRSREYGDPVRDADLFARISPIFQAAAITAPLLVLHGTRDPRVPYRESEQITAALAGRGQPVEFETFTYAGHGFIRPEDRARAHALVADFLGRTL